MHNTAIIYNCSIVALPATDQLLKTPTMMFATGNSDSHDSSHHFGTDGFQIMGLLNLFKTGDMQTDLLIAMVLPFILKFFFDRLGKAEEFLGETWKETFRFLFEGRSKMYERFISHSTTRNQWGDQIDMEDTQNAVLLKAINLYLSTVVKLKLKAANLDLTELAESNVYYDGYDSDDDEPSVDEYGEPYGSRRTLAGVLSRYKLINRLIDDEWHKLGEYGSPPNMVRLRIEQQSRQVGHDNSDGRKKASETSSTTCFHFESPGEEAIDEFIGTAYKWYMGELRKMNDNSRHLYDMKVPDLKISTNNNDDDSSGGISYRRYKLSDEKTFGSLFFPEKESLLGLIDHFNNKSGKYGIPGYPHKMGILLHGPPG
jgi:mitochondrial chaperone BCS1